MITLITIIILVLIAGYCNGKMDYIQLHNLDEDTWVNKWYWSNAGVRIPYKSWYYPFFKPEYKEAFPYSSTILVFLTDSWHFYKFMMFWCYECIISMLIVEHFKIHYLLVLPMVFVLKGIRGITFNLIYK